MNNEKTTGGLSYYRLALLSFLKESHHERLTDTVSIEARADLAATTYAQAIKDGYPHLQAEELANEVLFLGLHFSKHDTLVNILWNEFADDVPQSEAKEFAIAMLPECEAVFAKYLLADDFAYSAEFDQLYTELTGTIVILLADGVQ